MLEIARAVDRAGVPARRARSQGEWLRALARDDQLAALRCDRQESIRRVLRILARRACWRDRTTRPLIWCATCRAGGNCKKQGSLHPCLLRAARVARSTWLAASKWLRQHGWITLVRPGRTPLLSRGKPVALEGDEPNEAAIFVLCLPRRYRVKPARNSAVTAGQSQSRPLTLERSERDLSPARELPRTSRGDDGSPAFVVAFLRSQVAELRRGPGKTLSDRAVLAIARPFLAARWSPNDLAYAIGHDQVAGKAHRTSLRGVRQPASWLAWRLTRWCHDPEQAWKGWHTSGRWDHDDWPQPALSPAARVLERAELERAASEFVRNRQDGAEPSAEYLAVRKSLTNRRPRW